MAEPTNDKKRELTDVKKGKIDMHQRKQGETPKETFMDAPKNGVQEMDLNDVDNENKSNYQADKIARKLPETKNIDFGKMHDDFSLIKDAKKKPGAGE